MKNKFIRQLIEVEIRLGFISIPSHGLDLMPDKTSKIKAEVDGEKRQLSYNSDHRRIFGLTAWYKKNKAKPKDLIEISKKGEVYHIKFVKEENLKPKTQEKEEETITDITGLTSQAKGDIVEDRIKELLTIHGNGILSVYKPVTDTEGIDLIVVKNGNYHPIFIQVKGRFNLHQDRSLIISVKCKTFTPHQNFYVVGAFFNPKTLEIDDNMFLIPSQDLVDLAITVNSKKNGEWYRVVASLTDNYKGKWDKYLIKKTDLSSHLIKHFQETERFYK
jgi:hypothetical protein